MVCTEDVCLMQLARLTYKLLGWYIQTREGAQKHSLLSRRHMVCFLIPRGALFMIPGQRIWNGATSGVLLHG